MPHSKCFNVNEKKYAPCAAGDECLTETAPVPPPGCFLVSCSERDKADDLFRTMSQEIRSQLRLLHTVEHPLLGFDLMSCCASGANS